MDDRTFAQLLETLRAGPSLIEAQVQGVPDDAWNEVVLEGENGWTRRQLLAHMATNDLRQITRVRVGAGIGDQADQVALEAQGDVDVWNRSQVDARSGRSVATLVAEMREHRRDLIALLEQLTPEQRTREMPFRGTRVPLTTFVPALLGHLTEHANQLAP